jgi:hypothetical protein
MMERGNANEVKKEEVEGVATVVRLVLLDDLTVAVSVFRLVLSRSLSVASSTFSMLHLLLPLPTDIH